MITALVIVHVIIALVLTVIVLMQHGRQQGLSGAIAGGAETFFGKNKGRTIDAMLRKFTAVFAILFILSSIVLTYVSIRQANLEDEAAEESNPDASQSMNVTVDENGNLVDESGNIVMSAEDMAAQQAEAETEDAAAGEAEGAADAAEGAADEAAGAVDEAADAAAGAADQAADAAQQAAGEAAAE